MFSWSDEVALTHVTDEAVEEGKLFWLCMSGSSRWGWVKTEISSIKHDTKANQIAQSQDYVVCELIVESKVVQVGRYITELAVREKNGPWKSSFGTTAIWFLCAGSTSQKLCALRAQCCVLVERLVNSLGFFLLLLGRTAKNNWIQLCGGRNPAAAELTVGFASKSCSSFERHVKRSTEVGAAVPLHLQELHT